MVSVGTVLRDRKRDRWDRIGYGMRMVGGGGARRSLFCQEGKRTTK